MRTIWDMKLACVLALVTGCAAAKSAVGSLMSPKPNQITVVNEVHLPTPPPPAPVAKSPATAAVVTGSIAGAVAGAVVDRSPLAIAAGAGIGAALGYVVHEVTD